MSSHTFRPVVIAANKTDLIPENNETKNNIVDINKVREMFRDCPVLETSCRTGLGINEIFETCIKQRNMNLNKLEILSKEWRSMLNYFKIWPAHLLIMIQSFAYNEREIEKIKSELIKYNHNQQKI